ncbi:hypothetical protein J4E80_010992 [Alternaria sp. BMP 0032]|nr:hypothetical protein J4E80_010992 [Alternaria sp. BMP 0032]
MAPPILLPSDPKATGGRDGSAGTADAVLGWALAALDAQRFEVNLAVENALAEIVAPSPLDNVHDEGSDADSDEEDCEYDDEENP